MSGEWKWSEPHKDYYMYRSKPGTSELELIWGRAQVSPPTPQPAPASHYSANIVTSPHYSNPAQRDAPQSYSNVAQEPRYTVQYGSHGFGTHQSGGPYGSYAPSAFQNSYANQQAWAAHYTNPTSGNIRGSSTTGSGGSSDLNSAGEQAAAGAQQGTSTELQGYMSPMTSPHVANDPTDPASDDEDVQTYHDELSKHGRYISNTLSDPRYEQIQDPRKFFKKGRLFMVLWSEHGTLNNSIFTKVRRYVVLRRRQTHIVCLPIHTYGGLGTAKDGINPDSHAALVCDPDEAVTHPNEAPLSKEALAVVLEHPTRHLNPYSRIDFGRQYPIPYRFKVRRIGRIDRRSIGKLEEYFRSGIGVNEPEDEDD